MEIIPEINSMEIISEINSMEIISEINSIEIISEINCMESECLGNSVSLELNLWKLLKTKTVYDLCLIFLQD